MSYSKLLKDAGRFEDVLNTLGAITSYVDDSDASYPIRPIKSQITGEWMSRVSGLKLKKQARQIRKIILSGYVLVYPDKNFEDLLAWLDTKREMLMHNYSNYLSHGVLPSKKTLEEIRKLSVTIMMIEHIATSEEPYLPGIPVGWRKQGIVQKVKQVALFIKTGIRN